MERNFRLLAFLLMFLPALCKAQRQQSWFAGEYVACPKIYFGFNFGINNPNGLVGVSLEVPVIKHLSVNAGGGLSSWGWKYYGELRGYFGDCQTRWAGGVGLSQNTGLTDFSTTLSTTNGDEEVKLDLKPQTNLFINLYHFWNIGRVKNRFYLMAGYSIPLENEDYYVLKNPDRQTLSNDGEKTMKVLQPGGFAVGLGFYFNGSIH